MSERPHIEEDSLLTRRSLLSRLKNWDDHLGWNEFYDTYAPFVFNFVRKSGMAETDARDVVQDVFANLAKKMPGFRYDPTKGRFKAFLMCLVRAKIADHWRRLGRAPQAVPLDDASEISSDAPDGLGDDEWHLAMLDTALARVRQKVSARQYLLFDLTVIRCVPTHEITENHGVNRAQIYMAKLRVGRMVEKEIRRMESDAAEFLKKVG